MAIFLHHFLRPVFSAGSTFQTCILHSHYGHAVCGSMVDIQCPTAEIRRGKKDRRRKIELTGQKYSGLPYYIGTHSSYSVLDLFTKSKANGWLVVVWWLVVWRPGSVDDNGCRTTKSINSDHYCRVSGRSGGCYDSKAFDSINHSTLFRKLLKLSIPSNYGHPMEQGRPLFFCPVISIFFYLSTFFPRLISAVGDWMSTIPPHIVWP